MPCIGKHKTVVVHLHTEGAPSAGCWLHAGGQYRHIHFLLNFVTGNSIFSNHGYATVCLRNDISNLAFNEMAFSSAISFSRNFSYFPGVRRSM